MKRIIVRIVWALFPVLFLALLFLMLNKTWNYFYWHPHLEMVWTLSDGKRDRPGLKWPQYTSEVDCDREATKLNKTLITRRPGPFRCTPAPKKLLGWEHAEPTRTPKPDMANK